MYQLISLKVAWMMCTVKSVVFVTNYNDLYFDSEEKKKLAQTWLFWTWWLREGKHTTSSTNATWNKTIQFMNCYHLLDFIFPRLHYSSLFDRLFRQGQWFSSRNSKTGHFQGMNYTCMKQVTESEHFSVNQESSLIQKLP